MEAVTGDQTSVQLFYGLHPWTFSDNKKLRHWSLMPEWRRWMGHHSPLTGCFWGIHAVGGEYNAGGKKLPLGLFKPLRHNRYEGWYVGGGLTLGHAWQLSYHWRLEASVGVGYVHTRYHQYESPVCGADLGIGHYNYVGPTKLALNVAYVINKRKPLPPVIIIDTLPPPPPPPPYRPKYRLSFVTPEAEAEKARDLSGSAFLDFPVNKTDIRPDYRGNAAELAKVQQTIDAVRQDPNTTSVTGSDVIYQAPASSVEEEGTSASSSFSRHRSNKVATAKTIDEYLREWLMQTNGDFRHWVNTYADGEAKHVQIELYDTPGEAAAGSRLTINVERAAARVRVTNGIGSEALSTIKIDGTDRHPLVRKMGVTHPESNIIYYYNHSVIGTNALIIPETQGLYLRTTQSGKQLGVEMDNERVDGIAVPKLTNDNYACRNLMILRGGQVIIPKVKPGQWIEVRWTRHLDDMAERISMQNLCDVNGKYIDEIYKIGNCFYYMEGQTSTYMFQVNPDARPDELDADGRLDAVFAPPDNDFLPDCWYTLNGIKLSGKPQKPGLYLHNGKKVFVTTKTGKGSF